MPQRKKERCQISSLPTSSGFQIEFLRHGIHSGMGMEIQWEIEGILNFHSHVCVPPIEFIVGSVAVTYQLTDQVGVILRQLNAFS